MTTFPAPDLDERKLRNGVRAGYRTSTLIRPTPHGTPFADQLRAYIAGVDGPTLRPYAVTLIRGARGIRTWRCFTWAGARRLQRRVLDRAIARDARLELDAILAAQRAGRI